MRVEYLKKLNEIKNKEDIIYLDECGLDERIIKTKGWKKKGERLMGEVKGQRKWIKRYTIISALQNGTKLIAKAFYETHTNKEVFLSWIKLHLLPSIKNTNRVIIMDNASFHKNRMIKEAIELEGHRLLYLPPYSPDLNPIEHKWTHLKTDIRKIKDNYDSFKECLSDMICDVKR